MHSRRLEERQLLHRLSKIDDILAVQAAKKKEKLLHPIQKAGMSMEEALAIYMESVVPVLVAQIPLQGKSSTRTKKEELSEVKEVVEVSHIVQKQKENAKEHTKKKKEEKRNSFQDCMEDTGSAKNKGNRAYDKLDCSRKEAYLLYSYDKSGCHSIIGKDIGPGSYGGRLTSGDFGSKA